MVTRIPLAAGTMGVGYVVMALAGSLPIGALGCFIGGVGNGFYFVSLIQAIQDRTADEFQGRVMGLLESATAGCYGTGFLLAGAITALTSVRSPSPPPRSASSLATVWMAALLRGAPPSRPSRTPRAWRSPRDVRDADAVRACREPTAGYDRPTQRDVPRLRVGLTSPRAGARSRPRRRSRARRPCAG